MHKNTIKSLSKFITSLRKVTRVVSEIDDECLKLQHIRFVKNLKELTKDKSLENLKKLDSKQLIKMFVDDKELVIGVEFIIHSVFVSAIKVSVESIAESVISKFALHSSKIRNLEEEKVDYEMMIDCNGPEIGECDGVLKDALNNYFEGGRWHFNTSSAAALRTSGVATDSLLKAKSKLMIY